MLWSQDIICYLYKRGRIRKGNLQVIHRCLVKPNSTIFPEYQQQHQRSLLKADTERKHCWNAASSWYDSMRMVKIYTAMKEFRIPKKLINLTGLTLTNVRDQTKTTGSWSWILFSLIWRKVILNANVLILFTPTHLTKQMAQCQHRKRKKHQHQTQEVNWGQ